MDGKKLENAAVEFVARAAPWLAPGPSAYFVARAAMKHLHTPLLVAAIIAATIETLGISTVATALRLYDWNQESTTAKGNVRKGRTLAPPLMIWLSVGLVALYLVTTIGLTVALEVLADGNVTPVRVAPAVFPLLAVVGAVNLALRSNQARRELDVQMNAGERSNRRSGGRSTGRSKPVQVDVQNEQGAASNLGKANAQRRMSKAQRLDKIVELLADAPDLGPTELADAVGVGSRTTVYNYLSELEAEGRIRKNGNGVEVIG